MDGDLKVLYLMDNYPFQQFGSFVGRVTGFDQVSGNESGGNTDSGQSSSPASPAIFMNPVRTPDIVIDDQLFFPNEDDEDRAGPGESNVMVEDESEH